MQVVTIGLGWVENEMRAQPVLVDAWLAIGEREWWVLGGDDENEMREGWVLAGDRRGGSWVFVDR